jgi:hypothetical protein
MVDGGLDFVPLVDWGLEFGRLRWTGVWVSFSTSPEIWILGAREGKRWNLVDLVLICTLVSVPCVEPGGTHSKKTEAENEREELRFLKRLV